MSSTELSSNIVRQCSTTDNRDFRSVAVDKNEFCELLTKYFRPYVESQCPRNDNEYIQSSMQYFAQYLQRDELAITYMEFIFSLIENFRMTNSLLISNSIEEYLVRMFNRHQSIPMKVKPALLNHFPKHKIWGCEVFARCAKKLTINADYLQDFIFEDLSVMQRLLRYGVEFGLQEHKSSSFMKWDSYWTPFTRGETKRLDVLISYSCPPYDYRRRLFFVAEAIRLGSTKDRQEFRTCSTKLKLIFKTIPDPLITIQEVSNFLDLAVEDGNEKKECLIRNVCDSLSKEFPRSKDTPQPRNLKHLCRCQVRESMSEAKKLPHGVWDLPIPKILQNYIVFQNKKGKFDPEYVSVLFGGKRPRSESWDYKRQKTV